MFPTLLLGLLSPTVQADIALRQVDRAHVLRLNLAVFNDISFGTHNAGETVCATFGFLDGGTAHFHPKCEACQRSFRALNHVEQLYRRCPAAFAGWRPSWPGHRQSGR